jgi:hypothetical protein
MTQTNGTYPSAAAHGFGIVVDGLRKTYGNLVAVDGISFRVKRSPSPW